MAQLLVLMLRVQIAAEKELSWAWVAVFASWAACMAGIGGQAGAAGEDGEQAAAEQDEPQPPAAAHYCCREWAWS